MTLREQLQQRATTIGQNGRGNIMTQEQYVLDNGVQMASSEPLTDEQYDYLRIITGTIECLPKQCFYNAQMMTLMDDYNFTETPRVKYHEGYVFTGFMPILHGWITLDDKIVDVTLSTDRFAAAQRYFDGEPPQEDLRDRVLGVIPEGWEYIGVPMDNDYVVSFILEKMESRSLIDNWQDGWPLLQV
jgi:hypothetical protein